MKSKTLAQRINHRLLNPAANNFATRLATFIHNPANVGTPRHNRVMELLTLARQRKAQQEFRP